MSANSLGDVNELSPFRFWCQRVLPLVYDDNLSDYELLCKVVDYINKLITDEQQLVTAYEEDAAAVGDLKADLENNYARTDGTYPDMTVGTAQQLDSDVYTEDSEPYHFRKSGGGSVRVWEREVDEIVGGTVAWNQLTKDGNFIDGTTWADYQCSHSVINGVATITPTDIVSRIYQTTGVVLNHKYLMMASFKGTSGEGNAMLSWYGGVNQSVPFDGNWQNVTLLINNTFQTAPSLQLYYGSSSNQNRTPYQIKNAVCFDLTQMFGTTIADYIYSLEQSTAGAGVAFVRRYIDIDTYHPYDAGTLKSVEGLVSHDMVGFNQWDEEWEVGTINATTGETATATDRIRTKNFNPCIPNTAYYVKDPSNNVNVRLFFYDADKNYVGESGWKGNDIVTAPSNACFFKFIMGTSYGTTYNHDICINLSSDRNGEYEPYKSITYPLGSDVLRGIFKLDANNKLYADGDRKEADGTITRKYAYVDLGSLNWEKSSSGNKFFASVSLAYPMRDDLVMVCSVYAFDGYGNSAKGYFGANKTIRYYYVPNSEVNELYVTDESYSDAVSFKNAVSGQYVVYELATPTTEQSTPFPSPQVCYPDGTEEYVSTSLVPIGHYTKYPEDLKSKIEGLPWDFASLIAPTEASYKATQNYTSGSLLIVNNILYKATAAIANGGKITPGTNCAQTTLAAVIAAL